MSRYIFGEGEMPEWVSRRIMCYRKADGSTGYEIDNGRRKIELNEGDTIIEQNDCVRVIKKNAMSAKKRSEAYGKRI